MRRVFHHSCISAAWCSLLALMTSKLGGSTDTAGTGIGATPCSVAAPPGFVVHQPSGFFGCSSDVKCDVNISIFARPTWGGRHNVGVARCGEYCDAAPGCVGFYVYLACEKDNLGDCFTYSAAALAKFTPDPGVDATHVFLRHNTTPPAPTPAPPFQPPAPSPPTGPETMNGHQVILDNESMLMSWLPDDLAMDTVIRQGLAWFREVDVAPGPNGFPPWFSYPGLNADALLRVHFCRC